MHGEFKFIEEIGTKNGYPKEFTNANIRKTLGKYYHRITGAKIYSSKKNTDDEADN